MRDCLETSAGFAIFYAGLKTGKHLTYVHPEKSLHICKSLKDFPELYCFVEFKPSGLISHPLTLNQRDTNIDLVQMKYYIAKLCPQ